MDNQIGTPEWTKEDLEKCAKYDALVKAGKITYRRIR